MEPKIRLKGFRGGWEVSAFSDSFDSLKNNSLSRAELSNNGSVYNIHYGDVLITYNECVEIEKNVKTFVKDVEIAKKLHQSCAIKNGDIIFADAAEDNTVGKCTEVIAKGTDAIVSGLHTIPCRPKKEFVSRYLGYYLNSNAYHDQLLPHIQGTKISSISKRALAQTHISYPSDKNEQQAIASFFQHLDSLIQSTIKKIESLKQVKTASLQSMFPQEGENTPRLRFKGFEGAWNKVTIGECLEEVNEKNSPIQTDFVLSLTIKDGVLPYSEKGNIGNRAKEDHSLYKLAYPDTIVLNSMNILIGAIGMCDYFGCVSPVYYVLRCKPVANRRFMFDIMSNKKFQRELKRIASGMMEIRLKVPMDEFLEKDILIPSFKEQQKIADFFASLDSQLNLQTLRLEKLKQIKSACLDNMFV